MDLENSTYKMYFKIFTPSQTFVNNHGMLSVLHFTVLNFQAV